MNLKELLICRKVEEGGIKGGLHCLGRLSGAEI